MCDQAEKPIYEDLLRERDVMFFVDGESATPSLVLEVAEQNNYMADYVIGKEGKISEVHFDRIDQT
ncbi:MAG: hypothetical protein IKO41_18670 [Lachnospiraceae bacterium]|jgi:hypothetical protein|nr:hypothetical protein [Lachnospiraceae bacterium]MBR4608236.1 hypothetical protein [Lachnospiraceae bacterium]MBR6150617.1 hypothetical protein [Lachnospiraceae bacterium]